MRRSLRSRLFDSERPAEAKEGAQVGSSKAAVGPLAWLSRGSCKVLSLEVMDFVLKSVGPEIQLLCRDSQRRSVLLDLLPARCVRCCAEHALLEYGNDRLVVIEVAVEGLVRSHS